MEIEKVTLEDLDKTAQRIFVLTERFKEDCAIAGLGIDYEEREEAEEANNGVN